MYSIYACTGHNNKDGKGYEKDWHMVLFPHHFNWAVIISTCTYTGN